VEREREREREAVAKGDEETMASCCFSSSEMDSGVSGFRSLESILVLDLVWGRKSCSCCGGEKLVECLVRSFSFFSSPKITRKTGGLLNFIIICIDLVSDCPHLTNLDFGLGGVFWELRTWVGRTWKAACEQNANNIWLVIKRLYIFLLP